MSSRRSISWSAALRDMRSDRQPAAKRQAYIAAQHAFMIEGLRAKAGAALWTPEAGFNRRAIMAKAHANRRSEGMSAALKYAWACAHAARRAAVH